MTIQKLMTTGIIALSALLIMPTSFSGTLGVYTSDDAGFNTHTYYYDDGQEVTIIDTQFVPALTALMVAQIQAQTTSPITRVIVTHPNPDKFNGLSVLHKMGVSSIASKATAEAMQGVHDYKKYYWVNIAKAFTDESYPVLEAINQTFEGEHTIELKSGETLSLIELKNSGVSSTQTVVRVDSTGDLIVGDLVHYKAHAWLEGGIVEGKPRPNIDSWIQALEELAELGSANVYGGRGQVGAVDEVVAYQTQYLKQARDIVSDYVSATDHDALKDSSTASEHYAKIRHIFETAFPDSELSYLIGYGVYGLVNSQIAAQ